LNDFVKHESEKILQRSGDVNVLDLDLYDGKVAATREDAGKFMQAVKKTVRRRSLKALCLCWPNAQIATIGWCFGGGWSLQASI